MKTTFVIRARLRNFGSHREDILAESKEEAKRKYRQSMSRWTIESIDILTKAEDDEQRRRHSESQRLADALEPDED